MVHFYTAILFNFGTFLLCHFQSCLSLDVSTVDRQRMEPREWFIIPLEGIDQAITLLTSGEIIHYFYDPIRQEILLRQA